MKVEFGLLKTTFNDEEEIKCFDKSCIRGISKEDVCYIDTENSDVLCEQCGCCEKYQRKKEQQRREMGVQETPLIKGLDY